MSPLEVGPAIQDFRVGMQALREAIGAWRDLRAAVKAGSIKAADADAIAQHTEEQLVLAEAQIAKGLGYSLCTCAFPPTLMLCVGVMSNNWMAPQKPIGAPVHECPRCKRTDAGPFSFARSTTVKDMAAA